MEGAVCPVCFHEFASTQLEVHVNSHFTSSPSSSSSSVQLKRRRIDGDEASYNEKGNHKQQQEKIPCPIPGCQFFITLGEWDDHIKLHEMQEEEVQ